MTYDVAIIGSSFTGSLLAWILSMHGRRIALIDCRPHPRFSIGESSTPVADLLLERIAIDFGSDSGSIDDQATRHPITSLSRYGTWKRDYPNLICGKKRGFSYFRHHESQSYSDSPQHHNAMLVTASRNDELADTHWLRSDVDNHFFQQALSRGTESIEAAVIDAEQASGKWRLLLEPTSTIIREISCNFLVDAGGRFGKLQDKLGIADVTKKLHTNTRSTYGHFEHLGSWDKYLQCHGFDTSDYPFNSDASAQHHILDDGWLWMLRMDSGVASVGWTCPNTNPRPSSTTSPMQSLGIENYPSLVRLFEHATCVGPSGGLVTTGRLQRLANKFSGTNFALMPTAGATIDPLHSSGIAHGLSGVYRLASILLDTEDDSQSRIQRLAEYERSVIAEAHTLDLMVDGCYAAAGAFPLFQSHAMFYFIAAIATEERIAAGQGVEGLWLAQNRDFTRLLKQSHRRVTQLTNSPFSERSVRQHLDWTKDAIAPWNQAGLLDHAANNMYHYTAAPK